MKTTNKNNRTLVNKNINPGEIALSWTFFGNGEFTQVHEEVDYRMYLDSNYISISNKYL